MNRRLPFLVFRIKHPSRRKIIHWIRFSKMIERFNTTHVVNYAQHRAARGDKKYVNYIVSAIADARFDRE